MSGAAAGSPVKNVIRPEIQALRAVAVMAVVLNHLWPHRFTGGFVGVDIFFVISGYLITAHLLKEAQTTGRIRLAAFWARRARRLLPASLLVLAVAAVATLAVVPVTQWQLIFRQIGASALYVQNWALAADSVDYFASANSPSPVTHYWSLSVEEQFYLVWPLLVLAGVALARRLKAPSRRAVLIILVVVTAASLVASILYTRHSPNSAYFATFTRAWEFGAGGLLAVLGLAAPRRTSVAALVSWAGWAALAFSILRYSEGIPFPGYAAIVPVLGTVAVIVAGNPQSQWAPTPLVGFAPVQKLGDISYSLYLVHWPLIIFAPYLLGRVPGDLWLLAILGLSIVLAAASKRWVEDTTRSAPWLAGRRPRRSLLAAAAGMAVVLALSATPWASVQIRTEQAQASIDAQLAQADSCFGALSLRPGCEPRDELESPDFVLAAAQDLSNRVTTGDTCMQDRDSAAVVTCSFGVPASEASLRVALTGDSHAGHWIGALSEIAAARNWHVELYLKSSCPTTLSTTVQAAWYSAGALSCHAWSRSVVERLAQDPDIDVVVTSSIAREYVDVEADGQRALGPEAFESAWQTWLDAGKRVVVMADTPRMDIGDIPTCLASKPEQDCAVSSATALAEDPMVVAADRLDSADLRVIDIDDVMCGTLCGSVVGGAPVYGDGNHLTFSFSRSLAPVIGEQLGSFPSGGR